MDYEIRWSVDAVNDLERILEYLEDNWDKKTNESCRKNLSKRIKLLSRFPTMHPASNKNQLFRKSVLSKQTSII
ncbi:MAG: hypothetical protein Tsb0034_08540 [Ekhidna sp.]